MLSSFAFIRGEADQEQKARVLSLCSIGTTVLSSQPVRMLGIAHSGRQGWPARVTAAAGLVLPSEHDAIVPAYPPGKLTALEEEIRFTCRSISSNMLTLW
jgi:hypothetical protein